MSSAELEDWSWRADPLGFENGRPPRVVGIGAVVIAIVAVVLL